MIGLFLSSRTLLLGVAGDFEGILSVAAPPLLVEVAAGLEVLEPRGGSGGLRGLKMSTRCSLTKSIASCSHDTFDHPPWPTLCFRTTWTYFSGLIFDRFAQNSIWKHQISIWKSYNSIWKLENLRKKPISIVTKLNSIPSINFGTTSRLSFKKTKL